MALELEERTSIEVIARNNKIVKLEGDVKTLTEQNLRLLTEVTKLSEQVTEVEDLRTEVTDLRQEKERLEGKAARLKKKSDDAEASIVVATERARKANETIDSLRSTLEAEKKSTAAL